MAGRHEASPHLCSGPTPEPAVTWPTVHGVSARRQVDAGLKASRVLAVMRDSFLLVRSIPTNESVNDRLRISSLPRCNSSSQPLGCCSYSHYLSRSLKPQTVATDAQPLLLRRVELGDMILGLSLIATRQVQVPQPLMVVATSVCSAASVRVSRLGKARVCSTLWMCM